MKLEVIKNYLNLKAGNLIEKDDTIAEKLIRFGVAKAVTEGKKVVEELSSKELKVKDKKNK